MSFLPKFGTTLALEAPAGLGAEKPNEKQLFYVYRRLINKFRSVVPFDLSLLAVARKLNAAIQAFTEKLPKKSIVLSEHDRARIAQFFPYPIDEQDWRSHQDIEVAHAARVPDWSQAEGPRRSTSIDTVRP